MISWRNLSVPERPCTSTESDVRVVAQGLRAMPSIDSGVNLNYGLEFRLYEYRRPIREERSGHMMV